MTINLPKKPTGEQYEDFLAACLLSLGYFIETRLKLREESKEVLELDIVATPSGNKFSERVIFEAKSSAWGFSDIFKIYGWKTFLNIKEGFLIYQKESSEHDSKALSRISRKTNIICRNLQTDADEITTIINSCNNIPKKLREKIISCLWFQQIAQRLAFAEFNRYFKKHKQSKILSQAREYGFAVQQSFFQSSPMSRVEDLYMAYKNTPKIAGKLVAEIAEEKNCSDNSVWNRLNYTKKYLWLQYIMLLEQKARLSILKNALDYAIGTSQIDLRQLLAPKSFQMGLEKLKNNPNSRKIPYLIQIFIEIFGGFFFKVINDDLELLSIISGIDKDEIADCLYLINDFFPIHGGWFNKIQNELFCMKMIPSFVRGVGCFFRRIVYDFDDYSEKYSKFSQKLNDWHNSTYYG